MGEIAASILGADFPKIAGIGGLFFIVFGIIPGQIKLGPINLSQRDSIGRVVSICLGVFFAAFPLAGLYFGANIGLVSEGKPSSVVKVEGGETSGSLLISPAYAQDNRYTITVSQRSVVDTTEVFSGSGSRLYAGDIHLSEPNLVLIFRADAPGAEQIANGAELDEARILSILSPQDIFFLQGLKQGDVKSVAVGQNQYTISVEKVFWYFIGDDSLVLSVSANA